jgi:hypothetical protein
MPSFRRIAAARPALARASVALLAVLLVGAAVVIPTRSAKAATSVAAHSVQLDFTGAGIWGGDLHSTYALTGKIVPAEFYVRKGWYGSGGDTALITAVVERRASGGTWKATAQRVSSRSTTFRVHLPAYSTANDATVAYRLEVRRGGVVGRGDVSATITVNYRNPARFTGFTRSLYRAVHGYCPSAVVRVVRLSGDAAGDYTTGQYALRIDSSIAKYRPINQRSVALHECGHYLQWRNYGATNAGWNRMEKDAKAIFGTNSSDPVEHMADCIAQAANPGGYLGYGGSCTKPQRHAAKMVLAGYRAR